MNISNRLKPYISDGHLMVICPICNTEMVITIDAKGHVKRVED